MENVRKVRITDIKIVDRVRKDMGDLEELAESIKELGLLQPVIVTPELVLVAGERRVNACRMLGWEEIPAVEKTFEDYYAQLKAQRDENTARKPFTFSEMVELGMKLEAVEKERAKQRQAIAGSQNLGLAQEKISKQEKRQTDRGLVLQNFAELDRGLTRDRVAEAVGFGSGETYRKAKFIAEHADPELIEKLDAGEVSIHRAYREVKAKLEAVQREAEEAKTREEAERRRAEELAGKLAAAERALADARAGSAEAGELRAEVERLRREIGELKSRSPEVVERVVEKVVEVPVEKIVVEPYPALEAELEAVRRREEELRGALADERKRAAALETMVAQLKKELSRPRVSVRDSEVYQLLNQSADRARELGGALSRLVEKHSETLLSLSRGTAVPAGADLREAAVSSSEAMAYTVFRLALEFLMDKLAAFYGLLEERPRLAVLKGGKSGAEKV